jgi:hypothetical protein
MATARLQNSRSGQTTGRGRPGAALLRYLPRNSTSSAEIQGVVLNLSRVEFAPSAALPLYARLFPIRSRAEPQGCGDQRPSSVDHPWASIQHPRLALNKSKSLPYNGSSRYSTRVYTGRVLNLPLAAGCSHPFCLLHARIFAFRVCPPFLAIRAAPAEVLNYSIVHPPQRSYFRRAPSSSLPASTAARTSSEPARNNRRAQHRTNRLDLPNTWLPKIRLRPHRSRPLWYSSTSEL